MYELKGLLFPFVAILCSNLRFAFLTAFLHSFWGCLNNSKEFPATGVHVIVVVPLFLVNKSPYQLGQPLWSVISSSWYFRDKDSIPE